MDMVLRVAEVHLVDALTPPRVRVDLLIGILIQKTLFCNAAL